MKKIFAFILFFSIGLLTIAQESLQDVVYLKNGSILRGTIMEQVPNKTIKIQTTDRNVFVYQMDEIEKLSKEPIPEKGKSYSGSSGRQSGYLGVLDFSYGIGLSETYDMFQINVINGYRFNPYFSLGFGTGFEFIPKTDALIIPLYADLRGYFIDGVITPYLGLDLGYSILTKPDFQGLGMLVNPSIGGKFQIGERVAFNVGFGYMAQFVEGGSAKYFKFSLGVSF
jgi:hypothetical protein